MLPTRRFGRTGLPMPVLSLGGMRFQQSWSDLPAEQIDAASQANLRATLERAVASGFHHIETARHYGTSERQLGSLLPLVPDPQRILQTKVPPHEDPAAFEAELELSFQRLGLTAAQAGGGGPARATGAGPGDDNDIAEGAGWLGVFSRRHKFIVAPNAAPSLFDLEADPDELTNLAGDSAHRATVRRLGAALLDYARRHNDPLLATARVKSDLAWAVGDRAEYPDAAASESEVPGSARKKKRAK